MQEVPPKLPAAGDVVGGKYRVERVLGRGGMGTVLAVRHLGLDEARALKLMLPRGLELPQARERFFREARAAAKLRSEHAVAVHDVGVLPDGFPYIEMELLEGSDLAQLLKRAGGVPVAHAVEWIAQACEPVGEAHALGIVHRDLKPGNLFLARTPSGREIIKVLDFGIAKTGNSDTDPTLTGTNASFGSPMYMSPEQMRGARHADPRSDIWALGVVLFELMTGRRPFVSESVMALALTVTQEPAPHPMSLRPDVPPAVDAVVMRCLEKAPEQRFSSAAELALALRTAIGTAHLGDARGSLPSMGGATTPAVRASLPGVAVPPPAPSQPSHPSGPAASPLGAPLGASFGTSPAQLTPVAEPLAAVPAPLGLVGAPTPPPPQGWAGGPANPAFGASPPSNPSQPAFGAISPSNPSQPAFGPGASVPPSHPSVGTLSTVGGGSPKPALIIGGALGAAALGITVALVAWRATGDGTSSPASSTVPHVAAAPPPAPPSPSPERPGTEKAAEPPQPTPTGSASAPTSSREPATAGPSASASGSKAAPKASTKAESASRPGGPTARPKTGFGGID